MSHKHHNNKPEPEKKAPQNEAPKPEETQPQEQPVQEAEVIEDAPQENTKETKIKELEEEVAKQKKEYLFLMAEFDNFRKRTLKEKSELIKSASHKVLEGLLPIVDDFERGLQATADTEDASAVRQGMELIYNKLVKYLQANGVKPMETTGQPFDADLHEAIAQIPAPTEDQKGKIIDTVQKGYTLNDKVLRHAKVVVGQ